jgi:hypothetical protein
VPLARANARQCARLVEQLGATRPTVRQLGRLYAAWRSADTEGRARIVEHPLLYLQVEEAVKAAVDAEDLELLTDVEAIAGCCARTRKRLRDGGLHRLPSTRRPDLVSAWREAHLAFTAVNALLSEENIHADA